jgi:5S rRNA maturation endonuclease (ribonuclease M5)
MNLALKHTMNRFTYGSKSGKIGALKGAAVITAATESMPALADFEMTNSLSILPGMGVLIVDGDTRVQGKVWQKYSAGVGVEKVIVLLDAEATVTELKSGAEVYSRQLNAATIVPEYTGIQDIIFTKDNNIFDVDRSVFKTLNCTVEDLKNEILTESKLRDMADHVEVSCADDSSIKLVASNHKIVSTVEKQMYQFKDYTIDSAGQAFHLGRKNIIFDTYQLYKDKYSRDKNVVLLDTDKIGELVRKEFSWLTSGSHQILERRDGSEMYEGIMTKYADMYIEAFKSHAGFVNAAEEYVLND